MSIDPVAFEIFGLKVHWYGLLWITGMVVFMFVARIHGNRVLGVKNSAKVIDDLVFYGVPGCLIGGRLGYVLFYGRERFSEDPLWALRIWEGGMSFHGGVIGMIATIAVVAKVHKIAYLRVADLVCLVSPLGVACGRLGNLINGELWGKPTELPWGMQFAHADELARHPAQIYGLLSEGLLLYALLALAARRVQTPGVLTALFLSVYPVIRFALEFVREPDAHLGYLAWGLTAGQWLSLPMFALGCLLLAWVSLPGFRRR